MGKQSAQFPKREVSFSRPFPFSGALPSLLFFIPSSPLNAGQIRPHLTGGIFFSQWGFCVLQKKMLQPCHFFYRSLQRVAAGRRCATVVSTVGGREIEEDWDWGSCSTIDVAVAAEQCCFLCVLRSGFCLFRDLSSLSARTTRNPLKTHFSTEKSFLSGISINK